MNFSFYTEGILTDSLDVSKPTGSPDVPSGAVTVDSDYCNFLRKTDPLVPYTMDHKAIRPFVGILFSINDFHYYAPLTSPKPKHLQMKSQIDFLKINNGEWGAINLNNMIPVPAASLKKVDIKISDTDSKQDIAYKNLLSNQLSWCNSHKDAILRQTDNPTPQSPGTLPLFPQDQ